jgi:hypothetical protein
MQKPGIPPSAWARRRCRTRPRRAGCRGSGASRRSPGCGAAAASQTARPATSAGQMFLLSLYCFSAPSAEEASFLTRTELCHLLQGPYRAWRVCTIRGHDAQASQPWPGCHKSLHTWAVPKRLKCDSSSAAMGAPAASFAFIWQDRQERG